MPHAHHAPHDVHSNAPVRRNPSVVGWLLLLFAVLGFLALLYVATGARSI